MKRLVLLSIICFISLSFAQYPEILWWYDLDAPSLGGAATADIDNDGKLELVFGTYFNDERIVALNADSGTFLWDHITGGCNDASCAIADVDQDGQLEVVAPASSPYHVYCFNGVDGGVEWDVSTGYPNCIDSPPAVADVDNDGKPEVVLGAWYGNVFAYNGEDGSTQWHVNIGSSSYIQAGPNIVDLNSDGELDVVVAQFSGDCRVYALDGEDGSTLWYSNTPGDYMYHGGSFADIDHDDHPEIVIGCYDNRVYAFNHDSTLAWSYTAPYYIAAPTCLADLNNDNDLEVIFASYNRIMAVNNTGDSVLWFYNAGGSSFRGAAIADIDGNGILDVVFGATDGILRVLRGDNGQVVWTLDLQSHYGQEYDIDHGPVIADFNNDGNLDIFVVGGHAESSQPQLNHGRAYAISAGDGNGPGWSMFRHDLYHSACFDGPFGVTERPCEEQPISSTILYAEPNPCRTSATFHFNVPVSDHVTLAIYDISGSLVRTLVQGYISSGDHAVTWNRSNDHIPAGVYFVHYQSSTTSTCCKVIITN